MIIRPQAFDAAQNTPRLADAMLRLHPAKRHLAGAWKPIEPREREHDSANSSMMDMKQHKIHHRTQQSNLKLNNVVMAANKVAVVLVCNNGKGWRESVFLIFCTMFRRCKTRR